MCLMRNPCGAVSTTMPLRRHVMIINLETAVKAMFASAIAYGIYLFAMIPGEIIAAAFDTATK